MTDKLSKVQTKNKPKICAIDLDREIIDALQSKGLECFAGTLGSEVEVPNLPLGMSDFHVCRPNFDFPSNLHEYDILIVDLQTRNPIKYEKSEHIQPFVKGNQQIIISSSFPETIFDPRPLSANLLGKNLYNFFKKQTIIIVLSASNEVVEYNFLTLTSRGYQKQSCEKFSLYDFLPCIQRVRRKIGRNIVASNTSIKFRVILDKYNNHFEYQAIFEHPIIKVEGKNEYFKRNNFYPLLLNADNEIVAFADNIYESSTILVLPQLIDNKKEFLIELIGEVLPDIFPTIFPYDNQFGWLKSKSYLLPNEQALLDKKEKLEDDYKKAIEQIEHEIQQNKAEHIFLHNLLTETGDSLVKSVEQFLIWLGFTNIVNIDETNPEIKEEDIQILLDNGLLVVEIKGVGGTSKDSECSQISKIRFRRAMERNSLDVSALYLVNHQRYLPPHQRQNPPFSKHQIADAQYDRRGLLTTYELFKLYFNIENGFIKKEDARTALLQYGLVQFKPSNAYSLGLPSEIYYKGSVVILTLNNTVLHKGATIIFCNDGIYSKAEILEIQENDVVVESACNGEIGIKLNNNVPKTSELWLQDGD